MTLHITYLFKRLNLIIFQPIKHQYFETVKEAVKNRYEYFSKIDFFYTLNNFWRQAFKESKVRFI